MKTNDTHNQTCRNLSNYVVVGTNHETKQAVIFRPRCKQWDCPYCAPLNRDEWVYKGLQGAVKLVSEGLELRFITITSRAYASETKSQLYFQENWPKLQRRAKYHTEKIHGQKWTYFLVPEQHKSGRLHAHLMATTHLDTRWWKDNGYQCGMGYMAESEPVENPAAAAGYVTKYLGKSLEYTNWPAGFRRVRTSRNWPKETVAPLDGWNWADHNDDSADWAKIALLDYGYEVIDKRQN